MPKRKEPQSLLPLGPHYLPSPKTIGIVGSRRRNTRADFNKVRAALLSIYRVGDSLVSGGCPKGADHFATQLAHEMGIPLHDWLPDRSKLDPELMCRGLVRAAHAKVNYARNTLIARDAEILIACVAEDRKGGTEDTIKKFKRLHPDGLLILV